MVRYIVWISICLMLGSVSAAAAPASVGTVAAVSGAVALERAGQRLKLEQGTPIYNDDIILTAREAFAKVLLKDESLLTISAGSRFQVSGFATDAGGRKARFRLWGGKVRALVSKLATGNTNYQFQTPTAVAGVRGTHLVLEYDTVKKETRLSVVEGSVAFQAIEGAKTGIPPILVGAQQTSQQQGSVAPQNARMLTTEELGALGEEIASTATPDSGSSAADSENPDGDTTDETGTPQSEGDSSGSNDGTDETSSEAMERSEQIGQDMLTDVDNQLPTENPVADPTSSKSGIRVRW